MTPDPLAALLELAGETLRPETRRSFTAAWEWAGPRTRTEEEARLVAATLAVMVSIQALVVPRRLTPGALADLQITGTRSAPDAPARCHFFVSVTPDGTPLAGASPDSLTFSAAEALDAPFRCAARILGEMLTRLSGEEASG